MDEDESRSASELGRRGASKGGRARAERLTPSQRSESARRAAEGRWGRSIAVATHQGELVIGDMRLDCAVLDDDTRVLSQGTVLAALGRAPDMGRRDLTDGRPPFLVRADPCRDRMEAAGRSDVALSLVGAVAGGRLLRARQHPHPRRPHALPGAWLAATRAGELMAIGACYRHAR